MKDKIEKIFGLIDDYYNIYLKNEFLNPEGINIIKEARKLLEELI